MRFSIRREAGFTTYKQDLKGLDGIPIELALPYRLDEYLKGASGLETLAAFVRKTGIVCPSVHAPQGRVADESFMSWAVDVVGFTESVGAGVVVFHPETTHREQRLNLQVIALRNLRSLQRNTQVRIAVETFGSSKRVLFPEEVGAEGLSMVLDTSHVFEKRALDLIRQYHDRIVAIHLSEMRLDEKTGEVRPHLPITGFGFSVLEELRDRGWEGAVTLEYLPEYHDRLLPDRETLEALFAYKDA